MTSVSLRTFGNTQPLQTEEDINESILLPALSGNAVKRGLRHTTSLHQHNYYVDSSECPPSEPDSIFVAEPFTSSENVAVDVHGDGGHIGATVLSISSSVESLIYSSHAHQSVNRTPPPVHEDRRLSRPPINWSKFQLNTIVEQNSLNSLRLSLSAPRLESSSCRFPEASSAPFRKPSQNPLSSNAVLFPCFGSSCNKARVQAKQRRRRYFSLDDLNCLLPRPLFLDHRVGQSESSTSSAGGLQMCSPDPAVPKRPEYPPPDRSPTPPGIPTFGTPEAVRFRMPPAATQERDESGFVRYGTPLGLHNSVIRETSLSPSSPSSPEFGPRTHPMEVFKRVLGLARIVNPPSTHSLQRVALPSHLQALARAPDGTLVRGTFGNRASGHGIGRRSLENHPLLVDPESQRGRRTRTEDEVRRIDKACEQSDQGRIGPRIRQTATSPSIQYPAAVAAVRNQEYGSARLFSLRAVAHERRESSTNAQPETISPSQPAANREDHTDRFQTSQNTPGFDDIEGIREFIEQGERLAVARAREQTGRQKDRGSCERCVVWFCFCCCELDCDSESRLARDTERRDMGRFGGVATDAYRGTRETMRYR